ncbi:MAG: tRNA preQ1(34) S-adenosylmethionine ribosyltransferase-isomerase QueA [Prevotellaceae bacterium]|jgi:S-adenosylmethionine:tRNA ribosyltransferase-isomerase|nr:tRNA preQ1(34) S-adenosylmethionine ribosyltransferase-isomerase QueA [Prevotellaceae bacterium]
MKLSQFNFKLPPELIAKYPSKNRDESRLMIVRKTTGEIEHGVFKDIINFFDEKDVFVLNNTKVFPARLYGKKEKTSADIEVFLLRELNKEQRLWDVLVDPARKIRIGNKLYFGENDLIAEVIDNTTSRGRTLRFLFDGNYDEFKSALFKLGEVPLPRWVRKKVESIDEDRYQTIYAKHEGAVAPPFAGLHFSRELLKKCEIKGVDIAEVTLHLGLGSFREIDVEDLSKHKMDSEQIMISEETESIVNNAKSMGKKICAVGTTVLRTMESSYTTQGYLKSYEGWTNKFIFPPYECVVPDALVTNFHQPLSTLLMTVASFGHYSTIMNAYTTAVKEKYKFGVYGDAMLIID